MKDDQLYANGRVAVLSTRLLGADKFNRLAECNSLAEAMKVLTEFNFGGGASTDSVESMLTAELDNAMCLLKELCTNSFATEFFLCRYKYHNAKVLMKRKYMRQSGTDGCFLQTGQDVCELQEHFVNDDYSACTKNMAEGCDKIDVQFADGNRSPQVIDFCLDKAMYADMRLFAQKSHSAPVKRLFVWEADTTNLMLLYRFKKAARQKADLESWLIDGGELKKQTLFDLWDNENLAADLPETYKAFFALCTQANANLMAAERAQKTGRNKIIDDNADFLTIQPVLQYFFNKVDEIDKVRSIVIAVKNGVSKDEIKNKIK